MSEIEPGKLGFKKPDPAELKGADAKTNAKFIRDILSGADKGPRYDIVVLNAAAAIVAGDKAEDLKSAIAKSRESIDNGAAKECLEKLIAISNG
jgi:anthranilate phosphoribosyltransferase